MMPSLFALSLFVLAASALPSPFPIPFPMPNPRPQNNEDDRVTSTELCLEGEFEQFSLKMKECRNEAQASLYSGLAVFGNFKKALCQSIEGEIACFDTLGPKCLPERLLNINKYNFLDRNFEAAYNTTNLGQDFIDSCPGLASQEDFVVSTRTKGSTICKYLEVENLYDEHDKCVDDAKAPVLFTLSLSKSGLIRDPRALYVSAECNFRQTVFKDCLDVLAPCLDESSKVKVRENMERVFGDRQKSIRDNLLDDFTYEQCPQPKL